MYEVIDTISKAYKVPTTALYKDWERRNRWGDYVIPESQNRLLVQDTLNRLNELRREFWGVVKDEATEVKDKIKALTKLVDMELKILEASKALGLVNEELPIAIYEDEEEMIEKIVEEVAGPDLKAQEKLIEILQRLFGTNSRNGNTSSSFSW